MKNQRMLPDKYGPRFLILLGVFVIVVVILFGIFLEVTKGGTVRGIVTGNPCAPPCWQGMTPGDEIEKRDMKRKVRRIPGVRGMWENVQAIHWRWLQWPGLNHIYMEDDSNKIHSIHLSLDFELTVADVVRKYGYPNAVNLVGPIIPEVDYSTVTLFYPTLGLECRVKVFPSHQPILVPNSLVYEVNYFAPLESSDAWFANQVEQMDLQTWPGYGKLEIP